MRSLLLVALLVGCASPPPDDTVVGPFTGTLHRFTVDHLVVPLDFYDQDGTYHVTAIGDDLNGEHLIDNQLADILGVLKEGNNLTTHGDDMIASGVIRSVVEIQADDLDNDPHVGVTFHGTDGDLATTMGGAFIDGSLHSNRTRSSSVLGSATAILPIFADADPSVLQLKSLEIDLTPDGSGGYNAIVSGGITPASLEAATAAGLHQILAADPRDHIQLAALVGIEHDGTFTDADILDNDFIQSLLAPDLQSGLTSAGFGAHLSPCPTGSCTNTPPADRCHDRVLDQDETDVDCGGATCMPCGSLFACQLASDCQIGACDGGHCRAATCSDGILDGTEQEIDCGGLCEPCPP
jgi:hypothetical protein